MNDTTGFLLTKRVPERPGRIDSISLAMIDSISGEFCSPFLVFKKTSDAMKSSSKINLIFMDTFLL